MFFFILYPIFLPLLLFILPACGVDDSSRLPGGSGGARARVRARGPCSPLPGFRRARACRSPLSLASASSLSSAFAYGLGLGLALGLDPRLGLGLRPRPRPASCARVTGWFPAGGCRAWPAGSALLADTSRHFSPSLFGSNASQAAELSLLGFRAGLAWLIEPYQAPPGPASP